VDLFFILVIREMSEKEGLHEKLFCLFKKLICIYTYIILMVCDREFRNYTSQQYSFGWDTIDLKDFETKLYKGTEGIMSLKYNISTVPRFLGHYSGKYLGLRDMM
jgi:hypothetical protein